MKKTKMLSIISSLMMIAPLLSTGLTASASHRVHHHAPRITVVRRVNRHGRKHVQKINVKPSKNLRLGSNVTAKGPIVGPRHHGNKGLRVNLAYFLSGNKPILHNQNYRNVLKAGLSKQGDSYEWGATGPNRFDCSGLMQYMFKKGMHKHIPRVVNAQCKWTHHRVSAKNRQPGDFIKMSNGGHIGMYVGHGYMIDAQNYGVDIELVQVPWWHVNGYYRPNYNK